jgi:hypothetical protein
MRQLEEYLPNGFMWPTNVDVSPGRVTVRWAQAPLKEPGRTTLGDSVCLEATPAGVTMRAFFMGEYPYATGVNRQFEADVMAELLIALTRDWDWDVKEDGLITWHRPMAKPLPSDGPSVSDPGQENSVNVGSRI